MIPKKTFRMAKAVSAVLHELAASGMRVEIGDDFVEYRARRAAQKDRGEIYPMFDVTRSYVDETNGFWVCGFNEEGELTHTQAARLLDLSGKTLNQHFQAHRHKYITPNTTPDPDATHYTGPEALKTITGTVCYHGDFWLPARGLGGLRSQGATSLLSRLLFEIVQSAWAPDYMFALVPKQLAAKGAHLRYGYSHCEPGRWIGPDQQVTEEDYLIWMNSVDMANAVLREPDTRRTGDSVSQVPSTLTRIGGSG